MSSIQVIENHDHEEEILKSNPQRFVLFPIKYSDIWKMYKKALASFWTPEEIDLTYDIYEWDRNKLTPDEKHYISYVLAFFAASDGIVNENLAQRFMSEIQIPEARAVYSIQIAIECIHSETYSLLIDTLIKDKDEKAKLFNSIETIPCIKKKAGWALKWINDSSYFAERLVAFAAIEGIFFSGSFCSIFWFKKRGMLPGLCFSNELISRDEGLHVEFAILLYNKLKYKLSKEKVYSIIISAIECEIEFVNDALSVSLIGMNATLMIQYIKFVADHLIHGLGYPKLYNVENPFEWMEMISLQRKSNMFEIKISEYAKAGVNPGKVFKDITNHINDRVFNTNADF